MSPRKPRTRSKGGLSAPGAQEADGQQAGAPLQAAETSRAVHLGPRGPCAGRRPAPDPAGKCCYASSSAGSKPPCCSLVNAVSSQCCSGLREAFCEPPLPKKCIAAPEKGDGCPTMSSFTPQCRGHPGIRHNQAETREVTPESYFFQSSFQCLRLCAFSS